MRFKILLCLSLFFGVPSWLRAQYVAIPFLPVSETAANGAMPLAANGQAAAIYYDAADAAVVGIAATALGADVQRVTGLSPVVSSGAPAAADRAVFVGTVGRSPLINGLVAQGKIDVSAIQGKWESYTAAVVDNPVPGVARGLVIAGSDRRGAAFGAFGLSEAMGVSPWYWWADVTPAAKAALYVGPGVYTEPSPGVKYRGVFLNDEDWGLQPWAAKTFDPATNDIGPATYAKVFELLLRLHANFCWPAMHDVTKAFNTYPQNKIVADNYAIVMGSSHHEPMLRNTSEYNATALGPYNYWTNRTNIYNFWDQRVNDNAAFESIFTVGMRGQTDDGIIAPAGATTQDKVNELQNVIIPDQRQMIANHVAANPAAVPQIFVPYKEALTQYQAGLQVPDDVTLVWPDDNHGYIRELSTTAEQARGGGSGVYYHLSYWGLPYDFLWLCTTPPAMTWEEMSKAWDFNARRLWLVNIGDLKPGEIGADFFLRLARNPEAFRNFSQHPYLAQWAAQTFGAANAEAIAGVLDEYYRLNIIVRPEHLNPTTSGFNFTGNGDEAQQRLDDFAALVASANSLSALVPANLRDAFYQLVLYPVRASALMNQKVLLAERSRLWAAQGRAATGALAASATSAYNAIQTETANYNTGISGGKWNRMMSAHPHPVTGDVFNAPVNGSYTAPAAAGLGVAVEGPANALLAPTPGALPAFNPAANKRYFIDVFNTGASAMPWTAQASAPWITLSQNSGSADARILVGIDWTKAPHGFQIPGAVTIQGAGVTRTVNVTALNPLGFAPGALPGVAVENNGLVSIEAENFTSGQDDASGTGWRRVSQAAASRDAMTIFPASAASVAPAAAPTSAPSLTYQFYTFSAGPTAVQAACLPTHKINSEHPGCRYAVSLNGDAPQIVDIDADEYSAAWNVNVLRAIAAGSSSHTITAPGMQTLKIWMVDPGVVLDKFTITVQPGNLEAEALAATSTAGETYRTFTEIGASGGAGVALESVNVGDYVTFALPNLAVGSYDLSARSKQLTNRGKIQMALADTLNGTYTDIGGEADLYGASAVYVDLPPVRFSVSTAGTKYLKVRVTGRNAASTASWIILDRLLLSPVAGTVTPRPLEAEALTATSTAGETYRTFTEIGASGGAGVALESVNVGDYMTLALPGLTAGSYDLTVRVKALNNRGKVQMSVADTPTGPYTDVGGELDLYSATALFTDLPTARFFFGTPGAKYLKLRVTGRNAANTTGLSWIVVDRLLLTSLTSAGISTWRTNYFGVPDSSGNAADNADPDGDGVSNLMEYALGSNPADNSAAAWTSSRVGDHLTLTFPRQRDASDITYRVLAGNLLPATGSEIWSSATVPYAGGTAASAPVVVTDPQTVGDQPARFLWLKVTRP